MANSIIIDNSVLIAERDNNSVEFHEIKMNNITDTSHSHKSKSINCNKSDLIQEKLQSERKKALNVLEMSAQRDSLRNKFLERSKNSLGTSPDYNRSNYMSFNGYKTLNITDLQTDNTINLESPKKEISLSSNQISFEPSEITGRSTLSRKTTIPGQLSSEELTIDEILASSCSDDVRNLCESLRYDNNSFEYDRARESSPPKTADISRTSGTDSLMMMTTSIQDFSFSNAVRPNESGFAGESFTPAELMAKQLDADELSWDEECAVIPKNYNPTNFDSDTGNFNQMRKISDFSVNSEYNGSNISSLTNFFRQRSVDIFNVVGSSNSPERHIPLPLIDISTKGSMNTGSHDNGYNSFMSNPQNMFKNPNENTYLIKKNTHTNNNIDNSLLSTDIRNQHRNPDAQQDDSYMLSLSSIAKALNEIETDDTGASFMNRFLIAKKTKSGLNPPTSPLIQKNIIEHQKKYSLDPKMKLNRHEIDQQNWNMNNKENINPVHDKRKHLKELCDTASFTESLLDSSEFDRMSVSDTSNVPLNDSKRTQSSKITDSTHTSYAVLPEKTSNQSIQPTTTKSTKTPRNFGELSPVMHDSTKSVNLLNPESAKNRSFYMQSNENNQFLNVCNNRRSKSPSNSKELYAVSGASVDKDLETVQEVGTKMPRKRSRSANRDQIKVFNPTISLKELREAGNHRNVQDKSNILVRNSHLTPDYQMCQSNNSRSPSPSRMKLTTKQYETESPPNSSYYMPKSKSPSSHFDSYRNSAQSPDSPHSPHSLETTTYSERRYLMTGGSGGSVSGSESPECIGKMSLPTYGLVSKQPSNLTTKSRSNSQCSNGSEFSHQDGKSLPIKVTCTQFSWGSVKLRTNSKKSMQIKNFSSKRLVLKILISGPGFQIINLENDSNMITLQSQECRTVILNFCPTVLGVAIGTLRFLPPLENPQTVHEIPLYGYGGHAVVIPQDVQKGPIGCPFITMGELHELSRPLVRYFSIYNKGPLTAFAVVCVNSMGLDIPRLCDSIEIEPKQCLIRPNDITKFRCTFKPRRDDLKKIIKRICGVMTVANLSIITGDEPTRQRIRHIITNMNDIDRSRIASPSLDNCWKKFQNEEQIIGINNFKEQSDIALELVSMFRTHEIAITLNHLVMDETSISSQLMFPDADETVLFRTIVSNSVYLKTSPEHTPTNGTNTINSMSNNHELNLNPINHRTQLWSVTPNVLEIDFNDKKTKIIFTLHSFYSTVQYFEITTNLKNIFTITPDSGELRPNEKININVMLTQQSYVLPPSHEQIIIMIYMENEKITVPVKIKKKQSAHHHQSRLNY